MSRVSIPDFALANPIYAAATVNFYTVSGGVKTAVLATLYAGPTGSTELANPQTLDSDVKFAAPVYHDVPVIASVSGLTTVDDHDTGIIFNQGVYRGTWVTGTVYYPNDVIRDGANGDDTKDLYQVVSQHTSGTWATDKADATKLLISFDISLLATALPTPDDPGDDLKLLQAQGGAASWAVALSAFMATVLGSANAAALLSAAGAQAAATALTQGVHTIWIPAAAMRPTVSNGCSTLTAVETTAGRPDILVLDFDASSDEHAQFQIAFPKGWDEGVINFQAFWTSTATDTDGVTWALQGVSMSDGDTIDVAYGTAVTVDDANQSTAEDLYVTAASGDVTIAGTPAAGDLCCFRVFRDVSDANDTAAEDARLIGVKILFTIDAADDS